LLKLNDYCRKNGSSFISADCYGPYGQIFNDFGDNFEVLDKDGEEPVEVLIDDISIAEKGVVKLVNGHRHPYSDGDTIRIQGVKGMRQVDKEELSINGTIHTITCINPFSFEIGNTTGYGPY
jgi:ubiquitin-activating enzyme E1